MELNSKQNAMVRRYLQQLLHSQWDGNRSKLARFLGVSQPHISQVLRGRSGAGAKFLNTLSQRTMTPIDVILGQQPPDLDLRVQNLESENHDLRADKAKLGRALRKVVSELESQHEAAKVLIEQLEDEMGMFSF